MHDLFLKIDFKIIKYSYFSYFIDKLKSSISFLIKKYVSCILTIYI